MKPIDRLINELDQIFSQQPEDDRPEEEREQYMRAFTAIGVFLQEHDAPRHVQRRLYRLGIALDDLNLGKADTLLQPTSFGGGNAGLDTNVWIGRANAALGMAALIAAGDNREEAATSAMRAIGIKKSQVLRWYDEFRKAGDNRLIASSHAASIFDDGQKVINAFPKDPMGHRRVATRFFKLAAERLG